MKRILYGQNIQTITMLVSAVIVYKIQILKLVVEMCVDSNVALFSRNLLDLLATFIYSL